MCLHPHIATSLAVHCERALEQQLTHSSRLMLALISWRQLACYVTVFASYGRDAQGLSALCSSLIIAYVLGKRNMSVTSSLFLCQLCLLLLSFVTEVELSHPLSWTPRDRARSSKREPFSLPIVRHIVVSHPCCVSTVLITCGVGCWTQHGQHEAQKKWSRCTTLHMFQFNDTIQPTQRSAAHAYSRSYPP